MGLGLWAMVFGHGLRPMAECHGPWAHGHGPLADDPKPWAFGPWPNAMGLYVSKLDAYLRLGWPEPGMAIPLDIRIGYMP